MGGFERPGLELGMFPADVDMSDEAHQFTAVWLGVGKNPTAIGGNAAILKKSTDSGSGSGGSNGGSGTPAPDQQDTFSIADGAVASGEAYGFTINGTACNHTATGNETATDILNAIATEAKAAVSSVTTTVSTGSGKTSLVVKATTEDALSFTAITNLEHTADTPAPTPSAPSVPDEAGELKGGALGILQNRPVQGEACNVLTSGISIVRAGSDWAPGDTLGTDDDGAVVKVTQGPVLGIAAEIAASGDLSSILLLPRSAA